MILKELIERLEKEDPETIVPIGFNNPHSYRGYYEDLAFWAAITGAACILFGCWFIFISMLNGLARARPKFFLITLTLGIVLIGVGVHLCIRVASADSGEGDSITNLMTSYLLKDGYNA